MMAESSNCTGSSSGVASRPPQPGGEAFDKPLAPLPAAEAVATQPAAFYDQC